MKLMIVILLLASVSLIKIASTGKEHAPIRTVIWVSNWHKCHRHKCPSSAQTYADTAVH